MNMILDVTPVPFLNPINKAFEIMPLAMVNAYVPYASHLNSEEAAKVAAIRDTDEANSLLLSIEHVNLFCATAEGTRDELSVEPATLR